MRGTIPLDLLLTAYRQGAFPMGETAEGDGVDWIRPHVRAVLPLDPFRTPARLARAKPDAIVMHPGPMNRGVEIADAVADGPQSVILDQVANGVAVRMAVLKHLLGG